jgi:hypothetical protein
VKPEDIGVEHILENPGDPLAMLESLLLDRSLELGAPAAVASALSWRKMAEYMLEVGLVDEESVRKVYLRERLGTRGEVRVVSEGAGGPDVQVGDRVSWMSNGRVLAGRIVARVPAGLPVERVPGFPALVGEFGAFQSETEIARKYISWLVATEEHGCATGLHWPFPNRLTLE